MALCMRYARNEEEAQDILQEGFIRVFRKIHLYEGKGSLEGWVRKVFSNIAIRHYQKNSRIHVVSGLEDHEYELGSVSMDHEFNTQDLMEMVQSLPDGYRMVFNLFAIEGFSHEEIAAQLGITVGTSKSQLARARKALRQMIEAEQSYFQNGMSNG